MNCSKEPDFPSLLSSVTGGYTYEAHRDENITGTVFNSNLMVQAGKTKGITGRNKPLGINETRQRTEQNRKYKCKRDNEIIKETTG